MGCVTSRAAEAPSKLDAKQEILDPFCRKCKDVTVSGTNFCFKCGVSVWPRWGTEPFAVPLPCDFEDAGTGRLVECVGCRTEVLVGANFCRGCGRATAEGTVGLAVLPLPSLRSQGVELDLTSSVQEQLEQLLVAKPYLLCESHYLHYYVSACQAALAADIDGVGAAEEHEARDTLDSLVLEIKHEERTIASAFQLFDSDRTGVLSRANVVFMMEYLGFPCTDEDVDVLFGRVDIAGNGSISFDEFMAYVRRMGGCQTLFEGRRRQIELKRGNKFVDSVQDLSASRAVLFACGIEHDAQAAWRLVSSGSDLDAIAELKPCQQAALRHIRAIAQENHERALPYLRKRVEDLGFGSEDLAMVLLWIRDLSPIICHVDLGKVAEAFAEDTHYRNQFETNTSSGLLKHETRKKWERTLFGSAYESAAAFDRPKYGVQNIWNDYRGVMGCKQYGDSYVVLKDVRLRCTCSARDSGNLLSRRLAVLDFYAHVMLEYSDLELQEVFRVARGNSELVGDSAAIMEQWGRYKEVQIHGPISLDSNVRRLVVNERHRFDGTDEALLAIRRARQWPVVWMTEIQDKFAERAADPSVAMPGVVDAGLGDAPEVAGESAR